MRPLLTIGMATYDDYPGVESTIMALRNYHDLSDCELVIVDNHPESPQGKKTKDLVAWVRECPAKYVDLPEPVGTSPARNKVFEAASGRAVVCMDSHVMLSPGAVDRLKQFYRENPGSKNLHCGPMLSYGLQIYGTHFSDFWRAEMWGIWGQAWRCACDEFLFDVEVVQEQGKPAVCAFHELKMGWPAVERCPKCGKQLPTGIPYVQHEKRLEADGFTRCGWQWPKDEPSFEIPGQGLGLFSCNKDAWLGFNPHARHFGGEEMCIHEKYRKAGHKTICHTWLRWWHRFGRPCGEAPPYHISLWHKVRNYVLWFNELGMDLAPIHKHFVESGRMSEAYWKYLIADPIEHVMRPADPTGRRGKPAQSPFPQPPEGMTIEEIGDWFIKSYKRDLHEHFPKVKELASKCRSVAAYVKRREWLPVLLASRCPRVIYHCTERDDALVYRLQDMVAEDTTPRIMTVGALDSLDAPVGELGDGVDMLILAQVHSADRVKAELDKFGPLVRKWIVVQGTGAFGDVAEGDSSKPGLFVGIRKWQKEHPEWHLVYRADNQYGLSVISCDPTETPIDLGPGTCLHEIFESIGITFRPGCKCRALIRKMDQWGPEDCRKHKNEIIAGLKENQKLYGWKDKIRAAAGTVKTGLVFKINPADPFPGLVNEAIRRSEEKIRQWQQKAKCSS